MANFPTDDPARVETLGDVVRPITSGQTADAAVQQFATALQKALSTRFQSRGTVQANIQSAELELRVNDPDLDPNAGTYVLSATITLLVKSIDGAPPSSVTVVPVVVAQLARRKPQSESLLWYQHDPKDKIGVFTSEIGEVINATR